MPFTMEFKVSEEFMMASNPSVVCRIQLGCFWIFWLSEPQLYLSNACDIIGCGMPTRGTTRSAPPPLSRGACASFASWPI
jgi:hypothetical protein